LVSSLLSGHEPVRKVSIIARGMAAGYTLKTPKESRALKTKSEFLAELSILLAGSVAEKITFGEITTGAENDLEKASALARKLVKKYGMSSLGSVSFSGEQEAIFLGRDLAEPRNYSEEIAAKIDKEVNKFIDEAAKKAEEVLKKNKKTLEKLAQTLIKKETIERKEFEEIVSKKKDRKQTKKKPPKAKKERTKRKQKKK